MKLSSKDAPLSREVLVRPRESVVYLVRGDEDGHCNAATRAGITFCTLERDPKHSVGIIMGGIETPYFSTIHQIQGPTSVLA